MKNLPPIRILLGPAGSGKTAAALREFRESAGRGLLVVTTGAQAEWLSRRAESSGEAHAGDSTRIVPLSSLVTRLLDREQDRSYVCIGRGFQRIILSRLIPAAIGPGDFFAKMLSAPGFVTAFQERLREWKLSGAAPDTFQAAAEESGTAGRLGRKFSEIARLFSAYEQFLRDNGLRDEEDCLTRATELVRSGEAALPWDADRVVVDGFYRFTGAQRDFLRALAEQGLEGGRPSVKVVTTLPYELARPLLFAAPGRTLASLRAEFSTHEVVLCADESADHRASAPIRQLRSQLFATAPERAGADTETLSLGAPVTILDAPNAYVEAELVAREFRRVHAATGLTWGDFAVILRTVDGYEPILSAVFERYEIPLAATGSEGCAVNPLLRTALTLLDVVRHDWRREDVLAVLRSSYTAPTPLEVDRLRKLAWSAGVRVGREQWLALGAGTASDFEAEGTRAGRPIHSLLLEMSAVDCALRERAAPIGHFIGIVRDAVRDFRLVERIDCGEPDRAARDRAAYAEAVSALASMERISSFRADGAITFADFHDLLRDAWENAGAHPARTGDRVRIIEPHASREQPIRVCAVMGMTERVFPRRIVEDPFVRDDERRLLREWTGVDLEEQKLRTDDERFLFYLAATAPTDRLLLSFPRAARESDTLPSFFLDEVRAVLADSSPAPSTGVLADTDDGEPARAQQGAIEIVVRTLADVAPRLGETVTTSDVRLAACADLFDPRVVDSSRLEGARDAALRIAGLLKADDAVTLCRAMRSRSLPRLPYLRDERFRKQFIAGKAVYTTAELETYGRCPFRYLLRHTWNLSAESDGVDSGRQSALLHSVLRRYFRGRRRRGEGSVAAAGADRVFAGLSGILSTILQDARLNASAHQVGILQRRLSDDLLGFAVRETRHAEHLGMAPAHFHLTFGRASVAISPDALSCSEPLILTGADDGGSVALSGLIDRVDLDETGRRAHIVEYEVGRPPEFGAIQRGESLQAPINLLAIERLFGFSAASACYDSMQESGRRRFHRTEHVNVRKFGPHLPHDDPSNVKPLSREQYDEMVSAAEATALRLAREIGLGGIEATPGPHCRTCDFRDVCRTTIVDGHDGEQIRRE
jgi:ATP-dependent helicase/nuclease subunit B